MAIINANKNNINEIKKSKSPVIIDFYADWCGPCRALSKVLDDISQERDDIVIAKVNVESEPELSEEYGIKSIPTIIIMKDGEIKSRSSGMRPKNQILEMI